jgi:hypothetical protein
VPVIERLRVKEVLDTDDLALDLSEQYTNLDDFEGDFWSSFNSLDRSALLADTCDYVSTQDRALSVSDLAKHFEPQHDLESITLWLSLAREAECPIPKKTDSFELRPDAHTRIRYTVPRVSLSKDTLATINWESFEG